MVNTKKMLRYLGKNFPKKIAKKHHDYVGLMYGKLKENTQKILLCLDFDFAVLKTVKEFNPDLIISHHPFIYGTKFQVLKNDPLKKELCQELDKLDIPVYSLHTNFDEGKGGMNDALAAKIGLQNIRPLINEPLGRIGELEKKEDITTVAKMIKEKLGMDYGLLLPYGPQMVQKVAIIGGGGASHYQNIFLEDVDLFVSGDAPHYIRRNLVNLKLNYLDLPHEVEKIFMETLKNHLLAFDDSLQIVCVDHELLPKVI